MSGRTTVRQLQEHIALLLQATYKQYEIEQACDAFGMPVVDDAWTYNSKRVYVANRLAGVRMPEMLSIARAVVEELDDDQLSAMVDGAAGLRGTDGELKNLIFAAVGVKPRIVLRDAINNTIEIVDGADRCLVYDRPLSPAGLTRGDMLSWWRDTDRPTGAGDDQASLSARLAASLDSDAEKVVARGYGAYVAAQATSADVAALVPQVYLHYDPFTARELRLIPGKVLARQRMDFLLLLKDRRRVVVEVDGAHHYSENGRASPRRYSEMVAEDRRIRLDGYEVYRFGGYELTQSVDAVDRVAQFFEDLLSAELSLHRRAVRAGAPLQAIP